MWGIIGAMEQEIELIVGKMQDVTVTKHYDGSFYTGTIAGVPVTVAGGGIGKIRAALAAHIIIQQYGADRIINTGVAGGVSDRLKTCDVVISEEVIFHDTDEHYMTEYYPYRYCFQADERLIELAKKAVKDNTGASAVVGRIATGDVFVSDPEVKSRIVSAVSPLCVEMEGAAIGETAYMNDVPFVVIRSISDDAGETAQMKFEEYLEKAAAVSAAIVLEMIG